MDVSGAEAAVSRMCQEVTNTLETTTTSCVELGWLGSVSSSNGLHAAGMHSMQLYKCNKCMRLVLGCRVAEHQRKCGPPPLQQQHQNGQRPPKLPVSAPPKSAVPVMRKLPSVPTVLRPQATDTVRQATKLSKVTTTLDPEPEPLVVVVDVDADAIISGKWVSRRARSWNSRPRSRPMNMAWMYDFIEDGPSGSSGAAGAAATISKAVAAGPPWLHAGSAGAGAASTSQGVKRGAAGHGTQSYTGGSMAAAGVGGAANEDGAKKAKTAAGSNKSGSTLHAKLSRSLSPGSMAAPPPPKAHTVANLPPPLMMSSATLLRSNSRGSIKDGPYPATAAPSAPPMAILPPSPRVLRSPHPQHTAPSRPASPAATSQQSAAGQGPGWYTQQHNQQQQQQRQQQQSAPGAAATQAPPAAAPSSPAPTTNTFLEAQQRLMQQQMLQMQQRASAAQNSAQQQQQQHTRQGQQGMSGAVSSLVGAPGTMSSHGGLTPNTATGAGSGGTGLVMMPTPGGASGHHMYPQPALNFPSPQGASRGGQQGGGSLTPSPGLIPALGGPSTAGGQQGLQGLGGSVNGMHAAASATDVMRVPSPGVPPLTLPATHATGMMPTPGSVPSGGMMPTPGSMAAGGGMMPTPGAGGGMMPTPGCGAGSGLSLGPSPGSPGPGGWGAMGAAAGTAGGGGLFGMAAWQAVGQAQQAWQQQQPQRPGGAEGGGRQGQAKRMVSLNALTRS